MSITTIEDFRKLREAISLINDFCLEEYNCEKGADFSNLKRVDIAYTKTEDDKFEIQSCLNLIDCQVETYVDSFLVRCETYDNLNEFVNKVIRRLDFDDLVYVSQEELRPFYFYDNSSDYASEHNEEALWIMNHRENCSCARMIEDLLSDNSRDIPFNNRARDVIEKYGIERTMYVLANTVRLNLYDKRFSESNRKWANYYPMTKYKHSWQFAVGCKPVLVNSFIDAVRSICDKQIFYRKTQCDPLGTTSSELCGRTLVVDKYCLHGSNIAPQNQLFYADYSCEENLDNRSMIQGTFLYSGEKATINYRDFEGALRKDFVPCWAQAKISDIVSERLWNEMTLGGF